MWSYWIQHSNNTLLDKESIYIHPIRIISNHVKFANSTRRNIGKSKNNIREQQRIDRKKNFLIRKT